MRIIINPKNTRRVDSFALPIVHWFHPCSVQLDMYLIEQKDVYGDQWKKISWQTLLIENEVGMSRVIFILQRNMWKYNIQHADIIPVPLKRLSRMPQLLVGLLLPFFFLSISIKNFHNHLPLRCSFYFVTILVVFADWKPTVLLLSSHFYLSEAYISVTFESWLLSVKEALRPPLLVDDLSLNSTYNWTFTQL